LYWFSLSLPAEVHLNSGRIRKSGKGKTSPIVAVSCFCPFANVNVTYEVLNGEVVSQSVQSSPDNPVDEALVSDFYRPYNTIEKVFDYVGGAIKDADEATIEYDAIYGFPTNVSIDWIELAIDDETYLTISNFEALP